MTSRRFKKPTKSLAERLAAARRASEVMAQRRCPVCGSLCRWHHGNVGNRALCEKCGN